MKRITRKLLALLLTLALAVSLCPAVLAAPDTGDVTELTEVVIWGVVLPKPGENPVIDSLELSEGYFATSNSVRWRDVATQTNLTKEDVFEAGHTYSLDLYIAPGDGYVWAEKSRGTADVTATFYTDYSGFEGEYVDTYPQLSYDGDGITKLAVNYVVKCEEEEVIDEGRYMLDSLEFDLELPSASNTVGDVKDSLSATYNGKYDLDIPSSGWNIFSDTSALVNGNAFAPGETYRLHWEKTFDSIDVDNGNITSANDNDSGHTYLFLGIPVYINGENVNTSGSNNCQVCLEEIFTDTGCTYKLVVNYFYTLSSVKAPVITSQPQTVTGLRSGDTAVYTVKAQGEDLSYQWYYFMTDIGFTAINEESTYCEAIKFTGSTTPTLSAKFDGTPWLNIGNVYCAVSNSGGTVKSDVANYEFVVGSAPVITEQPQTVSGVKEGDTLTFSVKATGDDLTYHWYLTDAFAGTRDPAAESLDGETYSGITTNILTVKNVTQRLDCFDVYCIVSNDSGKAESQCATIHFGGEDMAFQDVAPTAWYYDSVATATEMGLLNGKTATSYCPEDNMTYAEAIKLAACMNQLYNDGKVTLTNGSPNWYSTYVDYCLEKKIITQDYQDVINQKIDRQTYAAIFAKALPAKALAKKNTIPDNSIPDVKKGSTCYDAIYTLYRAGILNGSKSDGTFNPTSNIKRSEVATILVRMMDATTRVDAPADLAK